MEIEKKHSKKIEKAIDKEKEIQVFYYNQLINQIENKQFADSVSKVLLVKVQNKSSISL